MSLHSSIFEINVPFLHYIFPISSTSSHPALLSSFPYTTPQPFPYLSTFLTFLFPFTLPTPFPGPLLFPLTFLPYPFPLSFSLTFHTFYFLSLLTSLSASHPTFLSSFLLTSLLLLLQLHHNFSTLSSLNNKILPYNKFSSHRMEISSQNLTERYISTRFLASVFFHESTPRWPLILSLKYFLILFQIL